MRRIRLNSAEDDYFAVQIAHYVRVIRLLPPANAAPAMYLLARFLCEMEAVAQLAEQAGEPDTAKDIRAVANATENAANVRLTSA
ncbi:MAG: hypothetical protein JJ902_18350 [Roseibium sp.]|nr:hypothetical protein [Roseibium sp.]